MSAPRAAPSARDTAPARLADRGLALLDDAGSALWRLVQRLGDSAYLLASALAGLPDTLGARGHDLRRTIVQQLYFTAVQAFWLINVIGIALGILVILPLLTFGITDVELQAQVIKIALFHQLVPLLTAWVVIGRSGTAVTAEMGEFRHGGVVDGLLMLGIEPHRFLILPRLLGLTFSLVLLTLWANLAAVFGAGAYNAMRGIASLENVARACAAAVEPIDLLLTLLMVVCYGVAIALIHCQFGLRSRSAVEVQRNLPRAFVAALLTSVGITVLFTFVRQ